jgi:DNA-binding MarR family transcriptional regulator
MSRTSESGRFAYGGLERVIHEKARLGILTSLAANPAGLPFNELKDLCALTDGNLSRHLQLLEEAGLVEIHKGFEKKRPRTTVTITATGKSRFAEYLNVLESVVADALAATKAAKRTRLREGNLPV